MNTSTITTRLITLKEDANNLQEYVINDVLENCTTDKEVKEYIEGVLTNGCVSGWVSSLTMYNQTHSFFNTYYDDIEELREEYEEQSGQPLKIKGDLKNSLSWLAYEETIRDIYTNHLGFEF